jgi:molecular chaperone GrpE
VENRSIPITSDKASAGRADSDSFEESPQFRVIDKRHFAGIDDAGTAQGPVEETPRFPTYVEELKARLTETERRFTEKARLVDEEISRIKTRLETEHQRRLELEKQELLLPFLDVLDNLERALQAADAGGSKQDLAEGLKMIAGLFRARLRQHAIEPLEVANLPFDPNLSQAVGVVSVSDAAQDGIVVEEVLPGYRMGESLVRPAQVRVGRYQKPSAE